MRKLKKLTVDKWKSLGYTILVAEKESDLLQKWRNWQTRTVQVRVVAIPCGFDSHLLHEKLKSLIIKGLSSFVR